MNTMITKRHKTSGWTRTHLGHNTWRIVPTDDSGNRDVCFLSAGSWANLPQDDRAREHEDRVILLSGATLPAWAQTWLETAHARSCARGRAAFRAALDDADWNDDQNTGW